MSRSPAFRNRLWSIPSLLLLLWRGRDECSGLSVVPPPSSARPSGGGSGSRADAACPGGEEVVGTRAATATESERPRSRCHGDLCLPMSRAAFLTTMIVPAAAAAAAAGDPPPEAIGSDDDGQDAGRATTTTTTQSTSSWEEIIRTGGSIAEGRGDAGGMTGTLLSGGDSSTTLEETISGFVAGATLTATKTLVKYPLDTATVRLQMPGSEFSIREPLRLFDGSYTGVVPPLVSNVPAGAVFFAVKDSVRAAMNDGGGGFLGATSDSPRWLKTCLAVAAAQIPYWLVRNPSEVVKTRQQAGSDGYGEGVGALDAYRRVRDDARLRGGLAAGNDAAAGGEGGGGAGVLDGLGGFYLGYWENILYAFPADVIKFIAYEQLTKARTGTTKKKKLTPAEGAIAGALSTAVAQAATTPLDVVRNRIMTRNIANTTDSSVGGAASGRDDERRPSYLRSLVDLAKTEGLSGLFAGVSPRIGKAVLSGAIQFATYEDTKQKLANAFRRE